MSTPNDILSLRQPHPLILTKTVPTTGDQIFKYMSQWVTFSFKPPHRPLNPESSQAVYLWTVERWLQGALATDLRLSHVWLGFFSVHYPSSSPHVSRIQSLLLCTFGALLFNFFSWLTLSVGHMEAVSSVPTYPEALDLEDIYILRLPWAYNTTNNCSCNYF